MAAHASLHQLWPTLATQPLPRHVRDLLGLTLKIVTNGLESGVIASIKDLETQIYRQIEITPVGAGREHLHAALARVESSRSELLLQFLNAIEAELAGLQSPQIVRGQLQARYRTGDELTLVNDQEIEETSALTDAAMRAELQNSLPLFLLGQRFGVMAGRPAFDAETLPVGPQALCRSIRRATERIGLDVQIRLLLYRAFERNVMRDFGSLVELLNVDLARNGVLPTLQYVPVRARRVEQKPGIGRASGDLGNHGLSLDGSKGQHTGRTELHNRTGAGSNVEVARQAAELLEAMAATHGGALASDQGFQVLRQLMASRRNLLGKLNPVRSREGREAPHVVSAVDLQEALRSMQNRPVAPVMSHGRAMARGVGHLKQDLLAMLRRVAPNQEAPALAEEHSDALDLVAMLYDNLNKNVKPGSTASILLSKLQVPLMRVALQDSTFFTQQEHPARQMLNTIAETGMTWLSEDENDSALVNQMHSIVDRAVHDYRGDPSIFNNVLNELVNHMQILTRKAEVAERRHVEAAQGKEKLALAREHASACVDALIKSQKLPRFTRTMLSQAWTDVMALTALRQGENSPLWHQQLQVAERLIEIAQRPPGNDAAHEDGDLNLQREIEEGLEKVGYQGGDVTAIAHRLVHPNAANADDSSSRTELTMRLKAQARLGEDLPGKKARRIPLTSAEQVQLERIQQTPVGAWFEFVINPQGDRVRRRLAWFSTATGATLFVNHRGQKNSEYTLESLARLLAKGQVSIVEEEQGTVIDRAWENVLTALRSFAVPDQPGEQAR
jgi:hypothetical protein